MWEKLGIWNRKQKVLLPPLLLFRDTAVDLRPSGAQPELLLFPGKPEPTGVPLLEPNCCRSSDITLAGPPVALATTGP